MQERISYGCMNAQLSPSGQPATLADARALFLRYAELVRGQFGNRVDAVWLYGSAARGDWHADSDIDVLVVLDREDTADVEWLVRTAYRIGLSERRLLLQPVVMSRAAFQHLEARERRFACDVLREGIAA